MLALILLANSRFVNLYFESLSVLTIVAIYLLVTIRPLLMILPVILPVILVVILVVRGFY